MNKKITLLLIVFLFSTFATFSQKTENSKNLLWEISGKDLKTSSYVFGTMHMMPKKDFFYPNQFMEKFYSCEVLVMEINMDLSLKEQLALAPKVKYPEGKTLKDYMAEEDYNKYRAFFTDTMGLKASKLNTYEKLKPFFAYSLILKKLLPGKMVMFEPKLSKMAKKKKMEIYGLETIDFQMDMVGSISIEEQVEMFLIPEDASKTNNLVTEFFKTTEIYKTQDIEGMMEMTEEEADGNEQFIKTFLTDRNKDWIPKIEKLIANKPTFIAVGAAHLGGEFGVLNLLREAGYTVTAVID